MTDNEKKFQDAQCAEHAAWAKKEGLPVCSPQRMTALVEWMDAYNLLKEMESVVKVERPLAPHNGIDAAAGSMVQSRCASTRRGCEMVKAKVGTGRVVHWATKTAVTRLTTLCTVTNTHNVNKRPYVWEVDGSTAVTCKNCLAIQGG